VAARRRTVASGWTRLDAPGPEAVKVSRQRNAASAAQVEYAARMTASAKPAWATNAGMFLIVASQISDSGLWDPAGAFGAMNDAGRSATGWGCFLWVFNSTGIVLHSIPSDTNGHIRTGSRYR